MSSRQRETTIHTEAAPRTMLSNSHRVRLRPQYIGVKIIQCNKNELFLKLLRVYNIYK